MLFMMRGAGITAMAAVALAALWLGADVQLADSGHLNGLFYTGSQVPLPPGSIADHTWRVRDAKGYDGQFYHLIAHDPLNRRSYLRFVDSARYRWRRIAIPALAFALGAGHEEAVDIAWVLIELLFVFLGARWLALYAESLGQPPLIGLAFLAVPGVAISLDRMLVDLPLVALTIGVFWFEKRNSRAALYTALAFAPLVRETGLLLIAAWCVCSFLRRDRRAVVAGLACTLPAAAWFLYVAIKTSPDPEPLVNLIPLAGLVEWTVHALREPVASWGPRANALLESFALIGIWLAVALSARVLWKARTAIREIPFPDMTAVVFALFAAMIGYQDIWATAYGLGRTLSPFLVALAVIALRERAWVWAVPVLSVVPRVALQMGAELRPR